MLSKFLLIVSTSTDFSLTITLEVGFQILLPNHVFYINFSEILLGFFDNYQI